MGAKKNKNSEEVLPAYILGLNSLMPFVRVWAHTLTKRNKTAYRVRQTKPSLSHYNRYKRYVRSLITQYHIITPQEDETASRTTTISAIT